MPKVKFTIITLFPDALKPYLETSMMWKAKNKGVAEYDFVNLRDFGLGPHKSVDDTPYGGGDGMVLRPEPIFAAIESIKEKDKDAKVLLPTPDGELWTQKLARTLAGVDSPDYSVEAMENSIMKERGKAGAGPSSLGTLKAVRPSLWPREEVTAPASPEPGRQIVGDEVSEPVSRNAYERSETSSARDDGPEREWVKKPASPDLPRHYVILCPHYEGYDARILELVDRKICLGPYVLTGGELPALVIIDSIVRLLPGVLGGETSAAMESFSSGNTIEAPQYTKPAEFRGQKVPDVLLSGDHKKVAEWRKSMEHQLDS